MLTLLSPAKTLDFSEQTLVEDSTKPALHAKSKQLIQLLEALDRKQLKKLMNISDNLADDVERYIDQWKTKYNSAGAKQAVLAFQGDVYQGLAADNWKPDDFDFAQDHLRILSGLYGVLRPLDLIQPYRLEMGTSLRGPHGKDLYDFWGDDIAKQLRKDLKSLDADVMVNLASNEYFKAAQPDTLDCHVITPVFKELHKGKYRVLSFFAKKARGMMADYLVQKRIINPGALKRFRAGGYRYNSEMSTDASPTFTRDES